MNCVIYTRVSSKEQEKSGFSIPAQRKLLMDYAQSHGYKIIQEFSDVETAKSSGRTQFEKLQSFLKENKEVKIILVEKTDRLYRNFTDYVSLEMLDVELHLVKENEIISKESKSHAKLIHGIKVVLAKNYIDNLSEEVKKGLKEKAEQGEWPHRAPLGYLNDRDSQKIVVDRERGPIIKMLFELYATGQYSISLLQKEAKILGLKYRGKGQYVSRSWIEKLLKNPIYTGRFRWKKEMYQGSHEPLITYELFDQVQKIISNKSKPKPRTHNFAFRGLLTCGYCGCAITAEIKKDKYIYYRCTNGKGKCSQAYIPESKLSSLLAETVKQVTIDSNSAEEIRTALKDSLDKIQQFREQELKKLNSKRQQIQSRIDNCYRDRLDGRIDIEFWQNTHKQLLEEQNNLNERYKKLDEANEDYYQAGLSFLELSQTAYSEYLNRNSLEQATLLKQILSNCKIKDVTLYPTYRTPFNLLLDIPKSELMRRR